MKLSPQFDKVILEISQEALDRLESNAPDSFKHIFGDKLRIIEPLAGGNEYIMKIKDLVGTEYEFDWEKWVGYKLGDQIKKNPMKVGKILNKRKTEIEKQLKSHREETEDNAQYFIKDLETKIDTINELLKVTNLHKQIKTIKSSLYIVYSKAPIDVVRMSDFDGLWSCHAEDGSYFKCSLADASYGAGVAYLITGHDYDKLIETFGDGVYTEDEIFGDKYRTELEPIYPVARQRLRRVLDSKGNELCVPQNKLYAKGDYQYNDDFKEQTLKWAKEQDISNFDFDSRLQLVGGEYEDIGFYIDAMIKKIWDKDISYIKRHDDSEFDDEEDDEARWQEEYDEAAGSARRDVSESTIGELIIGDVYSNSFGNTFNVDVDLEEMRLIYTYTDEFLDVIPDGKESSIRELLEDDLDVRLAGFVLFNTQNNSGKIYKKEGKWVIDLISEIPDPTEHPYFDYHGGGDYSFDSDTYYNKCVEEFDDLMASCFDDVEVISDADNKWIALKYMFNKEIYNKLELEYSIDLNNFDADEEGPIGSVPEKFTNFEYDLPNLRYGSKKVNDWLAAYTIDEDQFTPIYEGVVEFLLEFIAFKYGREISDTIKNNRWLQPKLFLDTRHLDQDFRSLYGYQSSYMLGDTMLLIYGNQPDNKLKFVLKPDANYMSVLLDVGGKSYKQFLDMATDIVNRDFDDNLEDYGSAEEHVSKRGHDQVSVELKRNGQQEFNFEESVEYHDFVRKYLP